MEDTAPRSTASPPYQASTSSSDDISVVVHTTMIRSPSKTASQPNLSSLQGEDDINTQNITCRKRKQPERDSVSPIMLETLMLRMQQSFDEVNKNISDNNNAIKEELSKLSSISNDLRTELNSLRQENTELKRSIASMHQQQRETVDMVSDLRTSLDYTSDRVDTLNQRVEKMELTRSPDDTITNEIKSTKEALRNIERDLNLQQQRNRLLNLEITGIPEAKNETLHTTFLSIANKSGVSLTVDDIDHITRVQPRQPVQGRPRSIVVKLKSRITKDNIIAGIRKRRGLTTNDLNMPGESKPIYVNEHLTPQNKALYKKCKEAAANRMVKFVWVRNCNIYMRKNETSPAVIIKSEDDLRKFR